MSAQTSQFRNGLRCAG